MPTIAVTVQNRIARTVGTPQIICGNSDYIIAFECDDEWNAYPEKTAVFSFCCNGQRETLTVPFTGYACYAPVITGTDRVEIGCCAGNIRTTSPASVPCCACITDIQSEQQDAQTDVYDELMELIALVPIPELADDEYFITTLEGDYVTASNGDYVIAKE